jgi:prolyl 4-hydroxylase
MEYNKVSGQTSLTDIFPFTDMEENCAPVCTACEDWVFEDRCPMPEDPEALNIWKPGDLDKLFQKLASEPYKSEYSVEVLSSPPDGPWVITVDNIITEAEAKRFIELGYDLEYQRSTEAGDVKADGTVEKKISKGRTSTNAWCMDDCLDDDVTINVSERISNLTGIPDSHGEYIQLLRYEPTQFYKTHHDWIEYHLNRSYGVRILTFFLYLNEVEAGGGTNFDQLDLTVEPKLGRALLWPSTLNDNPDFIDERTTHQALPVESGIKYGANVWFHQRDIKAAAADGCLE